MPGIYIRTLPEKNRNNVYVLPIEFQAMSWLSLHVEASLVI